MTKEKYMPLEEPVREPEPPKTPQQRRKEKWENFWYYYKKPFWIIVFIIAAILIVTDPFHPTPKPDYTVGVIGSKYWSDELQTALENALTPYGEDLNGDGKVIVDVQYYLLPEDTSAMDPNELQANQVRLFGDVEASSFMLYLCDEYNAKNYAELFANLETGEPAASSDRSEADWDKIDVAQFGVSWKSVDGIGQNAYFRDSATEMYFCMRAQVGTAANHEKEWTRDQAFFDRMRNNEPVNAELLAQTLADAETAKSASSTGSQQ